jgi:hypothetical protein
MSLIVTTMVLNLWMDGMTGLCDDSVESTVLVSSVVYLSDGTIGLVYHVVALHSVTVFSRRTFIRIYILRC